MKVRYLRLILAILLLGLFHERAFGHAARENYIFFSVQTNKLDGWFEFHVNDLKQIIGLEFSDDTREGYLSGIKAGLPAVKQYVDEHFVLSSAGERLLPEFSGVGLVEEVQQWSQFYFTIPLDPIPDALQIRHSLLEENGRLHRGLLVVVTNQLTNQQFGPEGDVALVFSSSDPEQTWNPREVVDPLLSPQDFVWQGILHIWIGVDHILFLVVLLLPAVLRREDGVWLPEENFKSAMWKVVKIVTLFTVAHSITLALAALDFIRVPSQVVESIIAASIVLVAVNNITPKFKEGSALIIFLFGLFHGMGFASVMGDIPFRMQDLGKILVAFNVGVEIGQLAIVVLAFGILFALRRVPRYQMVALKGGSAVAGSVAAFWFVERAFGL